MKQVFMIVGKISAYPDIAGIVGSFEKDIVRLSFQWGELNVAV